jgi:hypothetical protein
MSKGVVMLYTNKLYSKILYPVTDEDLIYNRVIHACRRSHDRVTHKVIYCHDQVMYKVT